MIVIALVAVKILKRKKKNKKKNKKKEINIVSILMMSAKLATRGLFEMKIFRNKGYDVIIFVLDVTYKFSPATQIIL